MKLGSKIIKRLASGFLALVMTVSALATTVGAEEAVLTQVMGNSCPMYSASADLMANSNGVPGELLRGSNNSLGADGITRFLVKGDKNYAFCVRPSVTGGIGQTTTHTENSQYWKNMDYQMKNAIALAMYYGYPNANTDNAYYVATQIVIWEVVLGIRDTANFSENASTLRNAWTYGSDCYTNKAAVQAAYDKIVSGCKNHFVIPSVLNRNVKNSEKSARIISYNYDTQKYETWFGVGAGYMDKNSMRNYNGTATENSIPKTVQKLVDSWNAKDSKIKATMTSKTVNDGGVNYYIKSEKAPFEAGTVSTTDPVTLNLHSVRGQDPAYSKVCWEVSNMHQSMVSTWDVDPTRGYTSFRMTDYGDLNIYKQFKRDNSLVSTDTAKKYMNSLQFQISHEEDGTTYYYTFKKSSDNQSYICTGTTTSISDSTTHLSCLASLSDGTLSVPVCNIPATYSGFRVNIMERVLPNSEAAKDGYSLDPSNKTVIVNKSSDPSINPDTVNVKFINSINASYGSVELNKNVFIDENETIDRSTNVMRSYEYYSDLRFVAFFVDENGNIQYLKNLEYSSDIENSKEPAGTGINGLYYTNDLKIYGNKTSINPNNCTTNIDEAQRLAADCQDGAGHKITSTDLETYPNAHFGCLTINHIPEGMTIGFMEIQGSTDFGHSNDLQQYDFSDIPSLSAGTVGYVMNGENSIPFAIVDKPVVIGDNSTADLDNIRYYGDVTVTKQDDNGAPLAGVTIGLYKPFKDEYKLVEEKTTDENGKLTFSTRIQKNSTQFYYIHEITALAGYKTDENYYQLNELTSDNAPTSQNITNAYIGELSFGDNQNTIVNVIYRGHIKAQKVDSRTGNVMPNVSFELVTKQDLTAEETKNLTTDGKNKDYKAGDVIATFVTDANGEFDIAGLPLGTVNEEGLFSYGYTVNETSVVEPYIVDTESTDIIFSTSNYDETESAFVGFPVVSQDLVIYNTPQQVKISVNKKDEDNKPVANVLFNVYADEDIVVNGQKLVEKDGFVGAFTTDKNGYCDNYTEVTTEMGMVSTSYDFPIFSGFKYYAVEKSCPEQYVLDSTKHSFATEFNAESGIDIAATPIEVTNKFVTGTINVVKADSENGDKLSGAEFEIYNDVNGDGFFTEGSDTKVNVSVSETSDTGIYKSGNLRYGNYLIKETKAPEGFICDDNYYKFAITENGQNLTISNVSDEAGVFNNKPIKGKIHITKIDEEYPDNKLSGATFQIYNDVNKNGVYDSDVDTINSDMTEVETGEYYSSDLRYGYYLVHESKAPDTFNLDDGYYAVKITENDKVYEVTNTEVGVGFADSPKLGEIDLYKVDSETKEYLTGATFTVYKDVNKNGQYEKAIDTKVDVMVEKDTGCYSISNLRCGKYLVKETVAPKNFKIDENYYRATITDNKLNFVVSNSEMTDENGNPLFLNKPELRSINLTKVNAEDVSAKLSNAEFTVYCDVNADGKYDKATDTEVAKLAEVSDGEYAVEGLRCGSYLVKETKAPDKFVADDNYYPVVLTQENKDAVKVSNVAEDENFIVPDGMDKSDIFVNYPAKGTIEITKTDVATSETLPDTGIAIYTEDGTEVQKGYTDGNGKITFSNLGIGKYYFKEFDAPEGYLVNNDKHEFEITENGQVIKDTLSDEAIPKTGVPTNVVIPLAIGGAGALALVVLLIFKKRKATK